MSEAERRQQRYVEDSTVSAPSVITLNAVATAHAVDDFLFSITGLLEPESGNDFRYFRPTQASAIYDEPTKDLMCTECGVESDGRLALGEGRRLPTRT